MTEKLRNEIVVLRDTGRSIRGISRQLHVSRKTVRRVLAEVRKQRHEGVDILPPAPKRRTSLLDPFEQDIHGLLEQYPDLTAVRLLEKLRSRGFKGGYSIVKDHLRRVRPRSRREPVERFETEPGKQGQMDYSPYAIAFTTGTRRVHAFSYVLGYSRRQYLHFVESEDFPTTLREHIRTFHYFGGVPKTCLYDNMKVVVDRWEDDQPIYNRRFLAFATHYGFQPVACRRRRPRTKGKVERNFDFVEKNLFNGRTFRDIDHLNEVTAWWMPKVADVRNHRETKQRPIDRYEKERPHLLALPDHPYDTAEVVYRTVDAEGYMPVQQNQYSVPWQRIGQELIVRITEDEVIIYEPNVVEITRHSRLFGVTGRKSTKPEHRPTEDRRRRANQLRERYSQLGDVAERFLVELVQHHRYGWEQASRLLSLLTLYEERDFISALARALRFRAFSCAAVERILAMLATPRTARPGERDLRGLLEELLGGDDAIEPRPGDEYDQIGQPPPNDDEEPPDGAPDEEN